VTFPPTVAISRLANSLKGVSSHRLRQEVPHLRRHHWWANPLRSRPRFAGPVGGAALVRQYIHQQNHPSWLAHAPTVFITGL
jgi:putative transposase